MLIEETSALSFQGTRIQAVRHHVDPVVAISCQLPRIDASHLCLVRRDSRNAQMFVFHLSQPCPLLSGAGQRRRSPWPLFPVSPARMLEYLDSSSRAVSATANERRPTGHMTGSTATDIDARARGAKSGEQVLARRRRAPATPRALVPLVVGASPAATPRCRHPSCRGRVLPWVPHLRRASGVL